MRNIRIAILALFLGVFSSPIQAQNLITNPSFENYASTHCGILIPTDFNQVMNDWSNPTQAAPQVFFTNIDSSCYNYQPFSAYAGPIGLKGNQVPRTGDVMVGLWCYTIPNLNQRQYVQSALSSPMVPGRSYAVEFYVSLGDSMESAMDQLGAYFSVNAPSGNSDGPLNFTPQVRASGMLDDVTNWVLISDTIVATDAYTFITIGNFYDDNATNTMPNPSFSGQAGTYGAFYFLDDVRVEEVSMVAVEDAALADIRVYPTLVQEQVNLEIATQAQVSLHDARGRLLSVQDMEAGHHQLSMAALSQGVYLLTIRQGDRSFTQRLVK